MGGCGFCLGSGRHRQGSHLLVLLGLLTLLPFKVLRGGVGEHLSDSERGGAGRGGGVADTENLAIHHLTLKNIIVGRNTTLFKHLRHNTGKALLHHVLRQARHVGLSCAQKSTLVHILIQLTDGEGGVLESKEPEVDVRQRVKEVLELEVGEGVTFASKGQAGTGADDHLDTAAGVDGRGEVDAHRDTAATGDGIDVHATDTTVLGLELVVSATEGNDLGAALVATGQTGDTVRVETGTGDDVLGGHLEGRAALVRFGTPDLNTAIRALLELGGFKGKLDFSTAGLHNLVCNALRNQAIVCDTSVGRIQSRVGDHVGFQALDL